ncbi:MAG: 2-C-methyl-D-erythritol 4-phosphate cytidylyltransferase [Elusimicrobiota bacterium]|jgi:2-C-methyl-D-erythritol 4-phosphate cytidylyltransferase|nr:2-C-methyl-D-erythritol 4-phosphate cytidylyltransferase [Elusimicrobiota bacterium]
MNIAVIFAGGIGKRMDSSNLIPKQFVEIENKPILIHTLEIFQKHKEIGKIYISMLEAYIDFAKELVKKFNISKVKSIVPGGAMSQMSIYNALIEAQKTNSPNDTVLIHDGVRPIVDGRVITDNIKWVSKFGCAVTAIPASETIVLSKNNKTIDGVPLRKHTFIGQAPQSFKLGEILKAHEEIKKIRPNYEDVVDSCTIYRLLGKKIHLVEGNIGNIKVTTPNDLELLKTIFKLRSKESINA